MPLVRRPSRLKTTFLEMSDWETEPVTLMAAREDERPPTLMVEEPPITNVPRVSLPEEASATETSAPSESVVAPRVPVPERVAPEASDTEPPTLPVTASVAPDPTLTALSAASEPVTRRVPLVTEVAPE